MKKRKSILLLLLAAAVVSCVSVNKNIKKAEEMLNQAQSIDAKVFAEKEFNEATVYYIAAKLDREDNKKKANSEAVKSRQLAQKAYFQSITKRMELQKQKIQTVKNEALDENAQILADNKFKEAELLAQTAEELRQQIMELSKRLKVFETERGVN